MAGYFGLMETAILVSLSMINQQPLTGSAEFIANIIAELQSLRQRVALLEGN